MPSRSPDRRRDGRHSKGDRDDDRNYRRSSRSPRRSRAQDERYRRRDRSVGRDDDERSDYRRRHDDSHRYNEIARYARDSSLSPRRRDSRDDDSRRPRYPHRAEQKVQLDKEPPQPGSIHRGTVRNIRPFGAFVELEGFRRHGLVHNSQISEEISFSREDEDEAKVKAMEFFAPVGSQVWVKVVEVRDDGSGQPKVNCSMKIVSQEDGRDLDPTNAAASRGAGGGRGGGDAGFRGPQSDSPPEVNTVVQASVASVKPYGIFVRLKGFRANGLVHLSQISDHLEIGKDESDEDKINALSAVHSVGDPLWVKVVEVTDDGGERGPKVACSIKLVDQREGTDLDPHNVKWQPRGEGGPGGHGRGPAQPAAVVQQGGAVDWGHLKAGDRQYGDAQEYEMVGDEVLAMLPPPPPPAMSAGHNGLAHASEPAGPSNIGSVEEAMAILAKYGKGGKKKSHKEKKSKKKEKDKDKKKKKAKKAKKAKKEQSSDSDTNSDAS